MPEFLPGESKVAIATMSNPTGKAFDYSVRLYMGTDLAIMAEVIFHLDAGEEKEISLPITMPSVTGTYPVYLGIFSNGQFIEPLYQAEDITIIPALVYPCSYREVPDILCGAVLNSYVGLLSHIQSAHGHIVPAPTPQFTSDTEYYGTKIMAPLFGEATFRAIWGYHFQGVPLGLFGWDYSNIYGITRISMNTMFNQWHAVMPIYSPV